MVTFTARRSKPRLVAPSRPTPRETKTLSDMDDHPGNRAYVPLVEFFVVRNASGDGSRRRGPPEDPAAAVEVALAEALVYYYPAAGRLKEAPGGKLAVDCNGEGVAFADADAAVRLEELGAPLLPPYPCVEDLLLDAGDANVVVGKPIVFMQVTRFRCGGFAIGLWINHCIADGFGMVQFLKAVADVARGEAAPVVLPVWERHLLMARSPPSTGYVRRKLMSLLKDDEPAAAGATTPAASVVCRHFLFGPSEIAALRGRVAVDGGADLGASAAPASYTRFELLTAAIWRCRAAAWAGLADGEPAILVFAANVRRRWDRIPRGYYGNALVFHAVHGVAAGDLRGMPLGRAAALVRGAKADDDASCEEHVRSTADFMAATRGMAPAAYREETYMVSDWTRLGEDEVDFGWAKRVAGGVVVPPSPLVSFNAKCVNSDGDESVVVTMQLPEEVMERFEEEINKICLKI